MWLSVGSEVQIVCIWSADATAISKPHHLLPLLNLDSFYLSGTVLPTLSWKRMDVFSGHVFIGSLFSCDVMIWRKVLLL